MLQHNSGTPGAISTKLGPHMAVCMYKNLLYILYLRSIIFRGEMMWEASMGSPHMLPIATGVTLAQIAIQATAR
jgi:hypothetical protein